MRPSHTLFASMLLLSAGTMLAQKTTAAPPTDTSVQASPIAPAPKAPAVDTAVQASPVTMGVGHTGPGLAPRTELPVTLTTGIDSGTLRNGQTVHATLAAAVHSGGVSLAAGTPVELTVVGTVPAGKMSAAGEFSLQLLRVGNVNVYTDTLTFRGQPGRKDVADSAPAVGTDAGLASGAPLTFHVQPPPQPATAPPANTASAPGSVNGTASGAAPPAGSTPGAAVIQSIDKTEVNGLATSPK